MASSLGRPVNPRRYSAAFWRTAGNVLLKRLRASRLDDSHDAEMRKRMHVDLLILDDFCLQPFDVIYSRNRGRGSNREVTSDRTAPHFARRAPPTQNI
jgi:DNA replication protein DnaC